RTRVPDGKAPAERAGSAAVPTDGAPRAPSRHGRCAPPAHCVAALARRPLRPPSLAPSRRRALRRLDGLLRGREHRQRLLDRAGEQARLDELAVPGRATSEADDRVERDHACYRGALRWRGLVVRANAWRYARGMIRTCDLCLR